MLVAEAENKLVIKNASRYRREAFLIGFLFYDIAYSDYNIARQFCLNNNCNGKSIIHRFSTLYYLDFRGDFGDSCYFNNYQYLA